MKQPMWHLLLILMLLICSYGITFHLFDWLPLPHLFHPNDLFMDFWNFMTWAKQGKVYETGSFYNPLLSYLAAIIPVDYPSLLPHRFISSTQLRDDNIILTFFVLLITLLASWICYISNKERDTDIVYFAICFFSAPVIFLLSRGNLLCFSYLLIVLFFHYSNKPNSRFTEALRGPIFALLTVIKPYFVVYELLRWRNTISVLCFAAFFISFSTFGLFLFNYEMGNRFEHSLQTPLVIIGNGLKFAFGHEFPVYELFSLNYSPLSYFRILDTILMMSKLVDNHIAFRILAESINIISSYVQPTLLIVIFVWLAKNSKKLSEDEFYVLFIMTNLTCLPNIGGYLAVLLLPKIKMLKTIMRNYYPWAVALLICPADFTFIADPNRNFYIDTAYIVENENYAIDIFGRIQNVSTGSVRQDMSLMSVFRPLFTVCFWISWLQFYSAKKKGVF